MMSKKFTPEQEGIISEYLIQIGKKINELIDEVNNLKDRLTAQENRIKKMDLYIR